MFTDFKEEILDIFLIQINAENINTVLQLVFHLEFFLEQLVENQGQLVLVQNGSENAGSVHDDIYFESSERGREQLRSQIVDYHLTFG